MHSTSWATDNNKLYSHIMMTNSHTYFFRFSELFFLQLHPFHVLRKIVVSIQVLFFSFIFNLDLVAKWAEVKKKINKLKLRKMLYTKKEWQRQSSMLIFLLNILTKISINFDFAHKKTTVNNWKVERYIVGLWIASNISQSIRKCMVFRKRRVL